MLTKALRGFGYGVAYSGRLLGVVAHGYGWRFIGVDVEYGAVCVVDFPYQHHAYHHWVAGLVVYFDRSDIHVADAQRHLFLVMNGFTQK